MEQGHATDLYSAMVGRQVPFLALIVPAFLVIVMAGWKRMIEVWPAVLTTGLTFAVMQYVTSNFISPSLVDVIAALAAMGSLWVLTRFWQPATIWRFDNEPVTTPAKETDPAADPAADQKVGDQKVAVQNAPVRTGAFAAWMPYVILIVAIFLSRIGSIIKGLPTWLDLSALLHRADWKFPWPGLHNQVIQHAPITAKDAPYAATITIDWLFSPGTIALIAALIAGFAMGARPGLLVATYRKTVYQMRWALLTIFMILAVAFVMNYSGATQTLGLALATTGVMFPLFSAYIGWLGVFLTGSDASSNSLFGPMQVISAQQLHISPILAGATNTAGGVMAKMISPQNLAIGATAIGQSGKEGQLLRMTFWWSLILAFVVGVIALLQATVLTWMIPG
jgi:glycolate permease/lactate permease